MTWWLIGGLALLVVVLLVVLAMRGGMGKPMGPGKALMRELDSASADVGEPSEETG